MEVKLSDKYEREEGTVFLTGMEAIVRLLVDKQRRDEASTDGHVNQTYVSGYEGSPLGGLDLKVVEQLDLLNRRGRTVHQFGINEKTAASAMLGTQYAPSGDVDAFWYGKAHGAMWVPDELWLANLAGTASRGAMVLLCGEDHRSKSSVSPGTSDWVLRSSMVPVFYPASVEEILRLGMHAIHLSRYLGVVTALKLVTPVCDGASTVRADAANVSIRVPDEAYEKRFNPIVMALGALPMQRELVERKLPLVEEYVRINGLNRIHDEDAGGEIGIVATGKSYTDVRQALEALGARVPVLQLSVSYPLDGEIIRRFARGLRTVYVVEEPGPFVEEGVKAALWRSSVEGVFGQYDEVGQPFIPAYGEVDPEILARLLWPKLKGGGERAVLATPARGEPRDAAEAGEPGSDVGRGDYLGSGGELEDDGVAGNGGDLEDLEYGRGSFLEKLDSIDQRRLPDVPAVSPMSCGGCPYNTFRDLKEKPGGAIGCSSIRAMEAYDYGVLYIPTMGAGGSIYSGTAPFNGNQHIFQYLGDGSYFHSGRGALQSCVQGGVNITFLLLYNGAVALTGGQQPGGQRPVAQVAREVLALGVVQVGIVSADVGAYTGLDRAQVKVFGLDRHAEALDHFKAVPGTTVLILDKECATERTRRQRRLGEHPQRYTLIHEEICEGCGDCYRKSEGCAALYSTVTEFGEKTQIRQASCAQDELCVDGECPAFLTVTGKGGRGIGFRARHPQSVGDLPEPVKRWAGADVGSYTILAVGRGGTGVVTISHLLAYAGMMDGLQVYLSNNTGLAQKGGPVEAPIVFGMGRQPVFNRLMPGSSDLYLGFDLLRAAEPANLRFAGGGRTAAVVSTTRIPTARINRSPDQKFPDPGGLADLIDGCTNKTDNVYLDSYWLAEELFGDTLFANMILLGAAYQAGRIPPSSASIEQAIELNGKAVERNIQAFRWGRLALADPKRLEAVVGADAALEKAGGALENAGAALEKGAGEVRARLAGDTAGLALLDAVAAEFPALDPEVGQQLSLRIAELCAYQNASYAREYVDFVGEVWRAEQRFPDRGCRLTRAVVTNLYKLMAYKDEYEVARLATDEDRERRLRDLFDGEIRISYNLHPPSLRWLGIGKVSPGPWFRFALRALVRLKGLRGSRLDPFGRGACRRLERELVGWYRGVIEEGLRLLSEDTYTDIADVAEAPDGIRGYEQVKVDSAEVVRRDVERRMSGLR
jgi:indolepyruvate ferredoxin oxidoreductase